MHLSWAQYVVVAVTVAFGAFAQGTVGFGLNLVAAPIVGLVAPRMLPAAMVLVGSPISLTIAVRERRHIDWSGVRWTTLGRVPGTLLGVVVVTAVPSRELSAVVGVVVLLAAIVSMIGNDHPITAKLSIGAGAVSGLMDTTAAVGGPPLALLYQHQAASRVRSTLATCFLAGTVLSLTALGAAGEVEWWHVVAVTSLLPALAIGLGLAHLAARHLVDRSIRPAVLVFAAAAGISAIARALV